MPTLRAAAELLSSAHTIDTLESVAGAIGFAVPALPVDAPTLASLSLTDLVVEARIAPAGGAARALLVVVAPASGRDTGDRDPMRDALPRIAARLATRAPHVLWLVLAISASGDEVAIAAWRGDRRPPRIAALVAHRSRVVDSDAETLCALAASAGSNDLVVHARWVDVLGRDALTARFYRDLEGAMEQLAASATSGDEETRREVALLDTSRLLFLCFLEAKGWLDGDRSFLTHRFDACAVSGGRFATRVLRPLFFGTLNTPSRKRSAAARQFGNIPFLNGGLFSRTAAERSLGRSTFGDDAYGRLVHDVFASYRFTAHEESTTWTEAAVDPEMLGKAFESLMASRERRRTGAFFTPFSLVEHVTANALDDVARAGDGALARLTVLDPACGSGAFLVHVLERIANRLSRRGDDRTISALRRDVLTRTIFGIDVNPTAVWLCQLRLWLSVVIESDEADLARVTPLPNLDRNIRVGDTLAGDAFTGDAAAIGRGSSLGRLRERYTRATGIRKRSLARELDRAERRQALHVLDAHVASLGARRRDLLAARRGRDLFGERYEPSAHERTAALSMRRESATLRATRRRIASGGALPFSFAVHFADVASRGGFGLVIGNPPWVRLHRVAPAERALFRERYDVARTAAWNAGAANAGAGKGFAAQVDVAALFVERAVRVCGTHATIALLVPAKLWRSLAGGGVRQLLATETHLLRVDDYSEAAATFDAAVYPSLVVARRSDDISIKHGALGDVTVAVHHRGRAVVEWTTPRRSLAFDRSAGAPWILLPVDARRAFDRLRAAGTPLSESVIGRPYLGVKCGCNDAFVVEVVSEGATECVVTTSAGTTIRIERSLVRPLLRGERLRRWSIGAHGDAILWTHDAAGSPLDKLPPLAARWFARWRHSLVLRTDARQRRRWWSLFRTEAARCDRPRVVWGDVGREPRASVIDAGDITVPLNSCYVARCADIVDAHAFAALLNGPLARAWLDTIAEPARGGYHRYLGWTLALLPVPSDWRRARTILAPFGERARRGDLPSQSELLEAALEAYALHADDVAPLVAWMAS